MKKFTKELEIQLPDGESLTAMRDEWGRLSAFDNRVLGNHFYCPYSGNLGHMDRQVSTKRAILLPCSIDTSKAESAHDELNALIMGGGLTGAQLDALGMAVAILDGIRNLSQSETTS